MIDFLMKIHNIYTNYGWWLEQVRRLFSTRTY